MLARKLRAAAGSGNPITFVASATGDSSNSSTTVSVNKPTGVQDGDLMIAVMCGGASSATWTGATGWTEVVDQNASPNIRIAYKVASGEGSSYTFTISSSVNKAAVIVAYRYASYDKVGSVGTATGTSTVTANSISVAAANSLLLAMFASNSGSGAFSAPSGMSSVVSIVSSFNPVISVFSLAVGAGATGNKSTSGVNNNNAGVLLAIRPV